MASSDPMPERCGARITSKVGIVVDAKGIDGLLHETEIQHLLLEKGAISTEKEPEYEEVIPYLRKGFRLKAISVFEDERDNEKTGLNELKIEDDDPYVTNNGTDLDGYCEKFPSGSSDSGRCYLHGADGGAPENNTNALTHGLRAQRTNYYRQLADQEKEFVEAMADSWIRKAPWTREDIAMVNEVYRISIDQHRLWNALDEYEDEGLITEQVIGIDKETGEEIEADAENPMNMSYSRLDKDNYSKLKKLGCLDDPGSQQAEATQSLAKQLSQTD